MHRENNIIYPSGVVGMQKLFVLNIYQRLIQSLCNQFVIDVKDDTRMMKENSRSAKGSPGLDPVSGAMIRLPRGIQNQVALSDPLTTRAKVGEAPT